MDLLGLALFSKLTVRSLGNGVNWRTADLSGLDHVALANSLSGDGVISRMN